MLKRYKSDSIVFAVYHKKNDPENRTEIAPFKVESTIITNVKDNKSYYYNLYTHLFDCNLTSLASYDGIQDQEYTCYSNLYESNIRVGSSVILDSSVSMNQVVLKMPAADRNKLLKKKKLSVEEILTVYDYACENVDQLKLTNSQEVKLKTK